MSSQGNARRLRKDTDFISKLPDTIIIHILSFLSTTSVIKTSILSKRWKYLWTKVPALDLTEIPVIYSRLSLERKISFKSFLDNILFHNDASCVQRFCLKLYNADDFYVNSWLTAAARREIVEINIGLYWTSKQMRISLPSRLLSCEKLVVLKLQGHLILNAWVIPSLPNLETVHLEDLKFPDNYFMGRLLCCCPILKELCVVRCYGLPVIVDVVSSTLESLTIIQDFDDLEVVCFVIKAPKVRYLSLHGRLSEFLVTDVNFLMEADVNVVYDDDDYDDDNGQAQKLLTKFSGVEYLYLGSEVFVMETKLPIFNNLTCLQKEADQVLCELLKCAPVLKSLVIVRFNYNMPFDPEMAPKYLPCLERIELRQVFGDEDFSVFAYFLKAASRLKEMKIKLGDITTQLRIAAYEKLLRLPRSSAVCQVDVVALN